MIRVTANGERRVVDLLARAKAALADMGGPLYAATDVLYHYEEERFDTFANGEWPTLKAETIAEKERRGYPEPASPLFATGDLRKSATSPTGPWSGRIVSPHQALVWLDWQRDGWQIPVLLSEGDDKGLPPRPIFDATDELVAQIAAALEGTLKRELAAA